MTKKTKILIEKLAVFALMFAILYPVNLIFSEIPRVSASTATTPDCLSPDTLGDTTNIVLGESWDGGQFNLQSVFNSLGYSIDVVNNQTHYQTWTPLKDNTIITVKSVFHKSGYEEVFGYLRDGGTFNPIFRNGEVPQYPDVPLLSHGQSIDINIDGKDPIVFAIFVSDTGLFRYSKNSQNDSAGSKFSVTYDTDALIEDYLIAFEDLPVLGEHVGDNDYNDTIALVVPKNCSDDHINQPPILTRIGANPISIFIGGIFTDPGATAEDPEDGDITANIVVTGTVDTNTVGSYTLTYNVLDSDGLAATPVTRVVNVEPVMAINATLIVTKIVCDSESDLPNWGGGGPDISSTTASQFLNSHPNCRPQADWDFQWATSSNPNPGSNAGLGPYPWTTFGSTNSDGMISTYIPTNQGQIRVREVFKDDYIPFTDDTIHDLSAEIYCHTDVGFYDNYDFVTFALPDGTYYCVAWNVKINHPPVNHSPVITLIGANPASVNVGDIYNDVGAAALDLEDGDITADIVATSTVNTTIAGSYTVTYNVSDSQGLAATPVSRTVNVLDVTSPVKGTITFCLIVADNQNVIATSSNDLPGGSFAINLASTTDFSISTLSKVWNARTFNPNRHIILSSDDADCVTFNDLEFGSYYYSELSVSGSLWNTPKYNDQNTQPVNNVFDFFLYSPELFNATTTDDANRNLNSDGNIVLTADGREKTLVMYNIYNPVPTCTENCVENNANISVVKVADRTTASMGDTVVYTITLTNHGPDNATNVFLTDIIPSELNLVSATTSLGSFATTTGIWTVGDLINASSTILTITAIIKEGTGGLIITNTAIASSTQNDPNTDDNTSSVRVTVNIPQTPCTVNCGGGGGGGGGGGATPNGPIVGSFGGTTPVPQVAGASTSSCYYLYDYLRKDFNNNPVEVRKLQIFLRDLEGFSDMKITGVYDDQTIKYLNAFQVRYFSDILEPWGHTGPTEYTYILTKKKVNEIYCRMAFPVTSLQQLEIDTFRNFLLSLRNAGINTFPQSVELVSPPDTDNNFGISSGTPEVADDFTEDLKNGGRKIANMALAFLTWPLQSYFGELFDRGFSLLDLLLLLIIIIISYLWYKERRNNKKIEDINKEIDLK